MDPIDKIVREALRLSDCVLTTTPEDTEDAADSLRELSAILWKNVPGHPAIGTLDAYRACFARGAAGASVSGEFMKGFAAARDLNEFGCCEQKLS